MYRMLDRAEIGGEQRSRRLKERRLKERVGLALLLEHLDLQLHVHVTSIFGGGIPASILNHPAAVTQSCCRCRRPKATARGRLVIRR